MSLTPRTGLPYVWVTWLTGLLSGDKQCAYQPWVKAHFTYAKIPDVSFNRAAWTRDHSILVNIRAAELAADGWAVRVENQNAFKLRGTTAILSGQPDIYATRGDDALVVDAKTGQQKHSDWWQVLIYMLNMPRVTKRIGTVHGEVVYPDHHIAIAPGELTADIGLQIDAMVRQIASDQRPPTVPSQKDCDWCDISECSDRVVPDGTEYLTDRF